MALNNKDNSRNIKRKSSGELNSNLVYGKVPPQARALEEAVLGALMLDKDALTTVVDILQKESFYIEAHQVIFKGIIQLFEKSQPVDLLTLTEELRQMGELENIGGPFYLVELTNKVASTANIEFHARIVAQKFIQRELIRVSTDVIKESYEETTDVFDLLDKAEQNLFGITEKNLSRGHRAIQKRRWINGCTFRIYSIGSCDFRLAIQRFDYCCSPSRYGEDLLYPCYNKKCGS